MDSFDKSNPYEWLKKYKVSHPTDCRVCGRSAYYHSHLGELCAAHFIDLVNVGQLYWKWEDREDVWMMMGRLLSKPSGTVTATSSVVLKRLALLAETSAGWKVCSTCKVRKEISNFSKNKNKFDGINIVCKPCDTARRKENKYRKRL